MLLRSWRVFMVLMGLMLGRRLWGIIMRGLFIVIRVGFMNLARNSMQV